MSELQFHSFADLFPLMEGNEFEELVADLKANGLREKIDLYQGKIVEGRNRYRALQRLGIDPSANPGKYFRGEIAPHEQNNDDRVRAYVISKNIHRRHLTPEQKRDLIAKVIAAKPEASDRQIAKQVKVDHKTVGSVRAEREATGEVSPVEKRTGERPAKKKRKPGATYWLEGVDGRSTPQRVSEEIFLTTGKINDFAYKLDPGLACELHQILRKSGAAEQLVSVLTGRLVELGLLGDACLIAGAEERLHAESAPPKKRGRPPGSKNKPKAPTSVADTAAPQCGGDNAPPPEVAAEIMKAKMAALDDGLDIPEPAAA
jgi:hypothetical protein